MPFNFTDKFSRQLLLRKKQWTICIPGNAKLLPPYDRYQPQPSSENFRSYGYSDPISDTDLQNNEKIKLNSHEFDLIDSMPTLAEELVNPDSHACYEFASPNQMLVLAAVKIGETLDVKLQVQFDKVNHMQKYSIPPGIPDSGYGQYPVHICSELTDKKDLRIVSSFEENTTHTTSRLPFFYVFRIYGQIAPNSIPPWRQLLSDSVIYAHKNDWGMGLLFLAIAFEEFLNSSLILRLENSGFDEAYINESLNKLNIYGKFHSVYSKVDNKKQVNRYYDTINKLLFQKRNKIAHAKSSTSTFERDEYLSALKECLTFIYQFSPNSRNLLFPVHYSEDMNDLIDEQLINDCK